MAKPGKFVNNSNNKNPSANRNSPTPVKSNVTTAPAATSPASVTNVTKPGAKAELKPNSGNLSRQAVAEAAYYLWLQRGGNETVNWLEAEAMLARKVAATK